MKVSVDEKCFLPQRRLISTSSTWLREKKLASFFVPRRATRSRGPPTETLARRAEKGISSFRACSDRPRSSTIPRRSKIVTQVCDNVVRIDDLSTNPAPLQLSSASLPRFWCPSSLELQLSSDFEGDSVTLWARDSAGSTPPPGDRTPTQVKE